MTSFAFGVLPLVIVISALSALLWYWRILPIIVGGIAFVLRRTLGLGGAMALASGATVFLGMIEAPLVIRPYLAQMTRTELFILFTVGLARWRAPCSCSMPPSCRMCCPARWAMCWWPR